MEPKFATLPPGDLRRFLNVMAEAIDAAKNGQSKKAIQCINRARALLTKGQAHVRPEDDLTRPAADREAWNLGGVSV
jgi:hemerythrin-like domain-containing protein